MLICKVKNCIRKSLKEGLCNAHSMRLKRHGNVFQEVPIKNIKLSLIDRFKEKIDGPDKNGCMNWIGCFSNGRYGAFITGSRKDGTRKRYTSHRLSYELFVGEIPKGLCVLHKCDNTKCVNPEHLFLGTQRDNMKDMIQKGRDFHIVPFGSKHGNSKLNEEQVMEIRKKFSEGISVKSIAKIYKISDANVRLIINKKAWKHIL
jgi:hypothetical protein